MVWISGIEGHTPVQTKSEYYPPPPTPPRKNLFQWWNTKMACCFSVNKFTCTCQVDNVFTYLHEPFGYGVRQELCKTHNVGLDVNIRHREGFPSHTSNGFKVSGYLSGVHKPALYLWFGERVHRPTVSVSTE